MSTASTLLPGISAHRVRTARLVQNVLAVDGRAGPPVLFVHGNVSSSLFWQPPVLWIRGTEDVIVSDTSLYDLAHLGALGAVPGWPGPQQWPAQPMLGQTRAVLDAYAAAGGRYRELALAGSGHGPHLDQPAAFRAALLAHLAG